MGETIEGDEDRYVDADGDAFFASQSSGGGLAQWLAQPASEGHPQQDHVRRTEFTLHHRNRLGELAHAGCLNCAVTLPKTTKNLVHKDMVGKRELLAPNYSCNVLVIQRGRIRDEHRDKGCPPRHTKLKVKAGLTKVAEECGQVTLFRRGTGGRTAYAWYGWVCCRTRQRSPRLQGLGDVCSLDEVGHLWRCGVWEELPFLPLDWDLLRVVQQ